MSKNVLYSLKEVSKVFSGPAEDLTVVKPVTLEINAGESIAIVGPSGSGKSTFLHMLGTLDTPSTGEILFENRSLVKMSDADKAHFRNKELGFVFQFHHLLPEFTTLENVALQGTIGRVDFKKALKLAEEKLEQVGLKERIHHAVTTLSGGERQRAAIARALMNNPKVILADEPTGNLDEKSGRQVADLLAELNQKIGTTLVIVTHNPELASELDRCLEIKGGSLREQVK